MTTPPAEPRPSHAKLITPGVKMSSHLCASAATVAISSSGLVTYLEILGPLFLGIVRIVAIFFLFTREIIRFVQFFVLAVAIAVIFYVPGIVRSLAMGIAHALGVHRPGRPVRAAAARRSG
jgi:hypothetical protein